MSAGCTTVVGVGYDLVFFGELWVYRRDCGTYVGYKPDDKAEPGGAADRHRSP